MKLLAAVLVSFPLLGLAQPSVPEPPAIWREVTGVFNTYPNGLGTTAVPVFSRPHIPGFRTSADGRIGLMVEGGGASGGTPAFVLMMPEKMSTAAQPFLLNPASATTMSSTSFNRTLTPANYTDGVAGVSHACLWDAGNNPTTSGGQDIYDLTVVVTSNSGTSPNNHTRFFSTPIRITVSNPKTATATIASVVKTGTTLDSGVLSGFSGSAFEPVVCGDGRLLITRVGSGNMPWTDPVSGAVHAAQTADIVYAYYPTGAPADPRNWTNLIPITHAPYDTRINTKFGFAMAPFRDAEGTLLVDGKDIGGSYPWIDREAKNLFFETVFDQLHYLDTTTNTYTKSRYPQAAVAEADGGETADYVQGEDGGKHQGVSFVGLWSHGKIVMVDNLLNDMDYAVGQGDTSAAGGTSTGPQHRWVSLFQPGTGTPSAANGWLRLGYGRSTKKMPFGENDNANIIDSIENLFNYRQYAQPISFRDVTWLVSDSKQADELSFDDYLDPDGFIIANMQGLTTYGTNNFKHWSGWNTTTKAFDQPVKLQNAATSTTDRWIVPKSGLVVGPGRLEPACTGGIHGKGFSMDGSIGLEFTVDAQPSGVDVHAKDWYVGIFVDCRFNNDTTERRLLTFPDGTSVRLYGRSQVLYADSTGAILNRISLPLPNVTAPTSAMDDLLPDTGWAHLAFQVRESGTAVDFYLNGILFSRWQDPFSSLFQMIPGKMTVGMPAAGGITGFSGWVDEFKVIAHAVDFETACNHAGGTLIGLPSTYTGEWKTKFADRYPSWTQTEISNRLANNGEATFPRYANYYNYRSDSVANRFSIPAGTTSIRQSIHFPEGPLFHNRPRPDTTNNAFCVSCHHTTGKGGLDLAALDLDTSFNASNDPRRQPMQPPARVYGHIPPALVDSTGLPTAAVDTPTGGTLIDPWMQPSFGGSTAVQTFTVVDANTHKDLMTLTANAVIDPAKLGTTALTIRANLNYAQGSATLQLDGNTTNTKTKPPYTAAGTDLNPWTALTLTPGAHTIKATPQLGALSSVPFNVAGGTTRVVAGYRADFKPQAPLPGWSYQWNALGAITNPANFRAMNWSPTINRYSVNGFPVSPDNSSTLFPYGGLTSTGGHPGRGVNQGATYDRFPIAGYTVKSGGYYAITSSFVTSSSTASNGGQVIVYTEPAAGGTLTQKFNGTYAGGATLNFNLNVGLLSAGDTIYVCVGPNLTDGSDSFSMDFSIAVNEAGNPLP